MGEAICIRAGASGYKIKIIKEKVIRFHNAHARIAAVAKALPRNDAFTQRRKNTQSNSQCAGAK